MSCNHVGERLFQIMDLFFFSSQHIKKKKIQRKAFGLVPPQCDTPKSQVILARRLAATISQNHLACLLWENDGLVPTRTTNPSGTDSIGQESGEGFTNHLLFITKGLSDSSATEKKKALHPVKLLKCGGARLIIKLS